MNVGWFENVRSVAPEIFELCAVVFVEVNFIRKFAKKIINVILYPV